MINTFIGNLGHLSVIVSFVFALLTAFAYFFAQQYSRKNQDLEAKQWRRFARVSFLVHGLAVLNVVVVLFYIIYNHHYEYHYAWSHSSNNLPVHYMISCFWEGQEGSFLLWIFWHVMLGGIIIATNKRWESPVMTVFALVQAFLSSMILGVVIFNLKIGSDPFILLRDAMPNIPVFMPDSPTYDPNYIPEDGTGLNPLLQNYWMVIHPPTLFLGFALTLVPFAYAIAGLWQGEYRDWVRPALPWSLVAGGILGIGILMGGYWAYETLNFGGYWNWDPVENAVYIPWLTLIASIHTMIAFRKSSTSLKASLILVVTTFVLILYSTFLTRSGILGDASVHSFTDLGLSGQLLLYLLFFTLGAIALMVWRWKQIPTTDKELSTYSREFWIFIGATVLCLSAFQVWLSTSIPVFNAIIEAFGVVSNLAPPADQVEHYTKFQIWGAILVALLSGTGQFFWWKKMDAESLKKAISLPIVITLLSSALVILITGMSNIIFILLTTASIYSVVANSVILINLLRKKTYKLSGGAIAHIGIAMMLLGILFSSGYSSVVSKNVTGRLYSRDFSDEMNENNVLLWLNKPTPMGDYQITYRGDYVESRDLPDYVEKSSLMPTQDPFKVVAIEKIEQKGKTQAKRGDTLHIYPENVFYRVDYRDQKGRVFSLYPRAQVNPQMGLLASPDIYRKLSHDLYTHVSSIPDPSQEREWSETEEHKIGLKDTFFLNDYVAVFDGIVPVKPEEAELMQLTSYDAGVKAQVRLLGENGEAKLLEPMFYVKDNMIAPVPATSTELGVRLTLAKIDPDNGVFTFAANTSQKDYVILKAMKKPLINVLWIGTLVLMFGFGIATYRRYTEFIKMRDKGLE